MANKLSKYHDLIIDVEQCSKCPYVDHSFNLISHLNGPLDADIMFVGEAPGKKTPGAKLVPFSVGPSSERFNHFLSSAGFKREEVHITNAVIHTPLDARGNSKNANYDEMNNCSSFLKRQIDIVNPKIVVPLGSQALYALNFISRHTLSVSKNAGEAHRWYGRFVFPLYHPSPLSKPEADQMLHYLILSDFYKHLKEQNGNRDTH